MAARSSWKYVDGGRLQAIRFHGEALSFILCYWQNFYPFGALTYPFWKDLETLTNEFKHKGTSPIRLAHPLIRIE